MRPSAWRRSSTVGARSPSWGGGSTEKPEVLEAMEAASGYCVQYDELAMGIGKRLAEIKKAPWGMVSAGCAAGMKHVAAASNGRHTAREMIGSWSRAGLRWPLDNP